MRKSTPLSLITAFFLMCSASYPAYAVPDNPGALSHNSSSSSGGGLSSHSGGGASSGNSSSSSSSHSNSSSSSNSSGSSGHGNSSAQSRTGGSNSNHSNMSNAGNILHTNSNGFKVNSSQTNPGQLPELLIQSPLQKRVIVKFRGSINENVVQKLHGYVHHRLQHLPVAAMTLSTDALKELAQDPTVESIQEDPIIHIRSQVVDWGMNDIQAPTAWSQGLTGKGIKVAVVDTGISLGNPDLVVSGGTSMISSSYDDDNGHGTHIAGIIGAKNNAEGVVGVAPDVQLYAVKAIDYTGSGYLSDVVSGIDWAITNHMDIINLSLASTTDSDTLHQIVDQAYNSGILVVAAAGNDGAGATDDVEYPAKYDSVIAVGAVDSSNQIAPFSSTGPEVEVTAPGVSVYSTYLNGGYATMSGTSMATPFVVGDLALWKQANPTLSTSQLRSLLDQHVLDLGAAGRDSLYGFGVVQAPQQSNVSVTAAPSNFHTTSETTNTIALAWDSVSEANTYQIKRNGVVIYNGNTPSFTDSNLSAGTSYTYTLVASNSMGSSSPVSLSVTTIANPVNGIQTTSSVTTDKREYWGGETILVTASVKDSTGRILSGAKVNFTVSNAQGKVVTASVNADTYGKAALKLLTYKQTKKGPYTIQIQTQMTSYQDSSATTNFKIK